MAKSKKSKPKNQLKKLQAEFAALQKSHRQLMLDHREHFNFDVNVVKKNLKRAMDRHESKPGQPMDPETMETMRDAHSTIALLQKSLANSRLAYGGDIPSHDGFAADIPSDDGDPGNGNDIPNHDG